MDETLKKYRERINEIDEQLMQLLQERFKVSEAIGVYKKQHELPVFDATREAEMQTKRMEELADNPYKQHIEALWQVLLKESKAQQQALHTDEE